MSKGLTLSQLYNEYVTTLQKLFRAEEENKRMTRYVEQILREIEEKAPMLRKQRDDYERALDQVCILGQSLKFCLNFWQFVSIFFTIFNSCEFASISPI